MNQSTFDRSKFTVDYTTHAAVALRCTPVWFTIFFPSLGTVRLTPAWCALLSPSYGQFDRTFYVEIRRIVRGWPDPSAKNRLSDGTTPDIVLKASLWIKLWTTKRRQDEKERRMKCGYFFCHLFLSSLCGESDSYSKKIFVNKIFVIILDTPYRIWRIFK